MVRFWAPSWKHWALATDPQQNLPLSRHSWKPVSKVSLVPARCQNAFLFSVSRGVGVCHKARPGHSWKWSGIWDPSSTSKIAPCAHHNESKWHFEEMLLSKWIPKCHPKSTENQTRSKCDFLHPSHTKSMFLLPKTTSKITKKVINKKTLKTTSPKIFNFQALNAPGRQLWAKRLPKCSQIDPHFAQDGRLTFPWKSSWPPLQQYMGPKWLQKPPETHFWSIFYEFNCFLLWFLMDLSNKFVKFGDRHQDLQHRIK